MQAGTTPKKRIGLNGRAALKLMRLDGARRADQAASDARVTKASSSIAVALLLISSGASATECQSSPGHDGKWWSYRMVDSKRCWYQGRPGRSKDLLQWAKQSPPPVVTRPDPGDSPPPAPPVPPQQPTEIVETPKVVSTVSIPAPTSKAPQMAAPLPSLPEPPPLPAKPTKPSKWWMLLLIIPAIATGLAVVASQFQRARKNSKTVDELAGAPGRPSRSNGGQHHAVVTPRFEASPVRSDFAKLGETIAASLVQAAQEHADHASVLLEQTKQFADDIRSQVAGDS